MVIIGFGRRARALRRLRRASEMDIRANFNWEVAYNNMQKEQEAGGSGASALDPWRQAGDEWIRALTNAQNAGASLQQQHSAYEEGVRRAKDR